MSARFLPGGRLEVSVDSFEWNKIAGWVLTASIAVLGLSIVTGEVFAPEPLEKQAFVVVGVVVEAEAGGAAAATEKPKCSQPGTLTHRWPFVFCPIDGASVVAPLKLYPEKRMRVPKRPPSLNSSIDL